MGTLSGDPYHIRLKTITGNARDMQSRVTKTGQRGNHHRSALTYRLEQLSDMFVWVKTCRDCKETYLSCSLLCHIVAHNVQDSIRLVTCDIQYNINIVTQDVQESINLVTHDVQAVSIL